MFYLRIYFDKRSVKDVDKSVGKGEKKNVSSIVVKFV